MLEDRYSANCCCYFYYPVRPVRRSGFLLSVFFDARLFFFCFFCFAVCFSLMLISFSRGLFPNTTQNRDPTNPTNYISRFLSCSIFLLAGWPLTGLFLVSVLSSVLAQYPPLLFCFFFSLFIEETFHASLFSLGVEVVLHLILMHYSFAILRHPRHDTNMCY